MDEKTLKLNSFKNKLVNFFRSDIERILANEVGSNFTVMSTILIAIESVSQFTEDRDIEKFKSEATKAEKALTPEQRKYLTKRYKPKESDNIQVRFMEKYFDQRFKKEKPFEKGENLARTIWKFRNAHSHTFYPYVSKTKNAEIRAAVDWMNHKNLERDFEFIKHHLYETVEDKEVNCTWFRVRPHILNIYFKDGLRRYLKELESDQKTYDQFEKNYIRLKDTYQFE